MSVMEMSPGTKFAVSSSNMMMPVAAAQRSIL